MDNTLDLLNEVIDIASSGCGGEMDGRHENMLKEAFEVLETETEREDFFVNEFLPYVQNSCGWTVNDIKLIKNLLNIQKPISFTI